MSIEHSMTIRNCTFAFKCQMKWENLYETEDTHIKFCQDCQKEVYYCESNEELVEAIKRNKCVSILVPFKGDLLYRETGMVDLVAEHKD